MAHEVFICYDGEDKLASDAVCHVLEENSIKCWYKARDFTPGDTVDTITRAIQSSECVVLLYSKNAKTSDHVVTETDIAFSSGKSIIVFNLDNSNKKGDLEFFLKNKHWLAAFPNPSKQFESLIIDTSNFLGRPIDNVKVSPNDVKQLEKVIPSNRDYGKYLKIAVPVLVILVLIFYFVVLPMGQHTTDDGNFSMKITDVDVKGANGKYIYTVFGESYNLPEDSIKYIMKTDYYDSQNNKVFSVNASADEFKGGVITQFDVSHDNITRVEFKLVDMSDKILCNQTYKVK